MMKILCTIGLGIILSLWITEPSWADTIGCGTRAEIAGQIGDGYDERPVGLGVTSVGTVMELWNAPDGATWTLVVTLPNGQSCVVGAGTDWQAVAPKPAGVDG